MTLANLRGVAPGWSTTIIPGGGPVLGGLGTQWQFHGVAGEPTGEPPVSPSGEFDIVITYDESVQRAPAGFRAGVEAAVSFLESQFHDPITVNIEVRYGFAGEEGLASSARATPLLVDYSTLRDALVRDATSEVDSTATLNLPFADLTGGGLFWLTPAQARAMGLPAGSAGEFDGTTTFSDDVIFDFDRSNGISFNEFDFFAVAVHEFTHIMGRIADNLSNYALDLFHFADVGVRTLEWGGPTSGFFSIDLGRTNLNNFSPVQTFSDWADTAGPDAFLASSGPGVILRVSEVDLRVMDVLGYDRVSSGTIGTLGGQLSGTVFGGAADDVIVGDGANNSVLGSTGNDYLLERV
jgi:hypothetical protein